MLNPRSQIHFYQTNSINTLKVWKIYLATTNHSLHFPLFLVPIVCKNFEGWAPLFNLHFPIQHNTGWNHYKMWTPYACELDNVIATQQITMTKIHVLRMICHISSSNVYFVG